MAPLRRRGDRQRRGRRCCSSTRSSSPCGRSSRADRGEPARRGRHELAGRRCSGCTSARPPPWAWWRSLLAVSPCWSPGRESGCVVPASALQGCRWSCWARSWPWSSANPGIGGLPGGGSAEDPCLRRPAHRHGPGGGGGAVDGEPLGRRDRRRAARHPGRAADVAVVVLLLLLPAVQAAGTGNSLAYLAVNQFACWTALMVAACTMPGRVPLPRGPRGVGDRLRRRRGRDDGRRRVVAAPLPDRCVVRRHRRGSAAPARSRHARSMPATAERLRAVRAAVGEPPAGDPVMAFDEMAGVVLLLDGRSVGEAWYSRIDPARTAAGHPQRVHPPAPVGRRAPGRRLRPGAGHGRPGRPARLRALTGPRLQTGEGRRTWPDCRSSSRPAPSRGATMTEPSARGTRHAAWSRS